MPDDLAGTLGDERNDEILVALDCLDQIGLERSREGGEMDGADRRRVARLGRPDAGAHVTLMSGASSAFIPITL